VNKYCFLILLNIISSISYSAVSFPATKGYVEVASDYDIVVNPSSEKFYCEKALLNFYKMMTRGVEVLLKKKTGEEIIVIRVEKKKKKLYFFIDNKKLPVGRVSVTEKPDNAKQLFLNNYLVEVDTEKSRTLIVKLLKQLFARYKSLDLSPNG
jgi:hypothetical protein